MSHHQKPPGRLGLPELRNLYDRGEKIVAITCYDYSFAKLIDQTKADIVLVGDSLGGVMMGYEDTLRVTIDDMAHHTKSVARGCLRPFLVADMPFMSYGVTEAETIHNASLLIRAGAGAVKLEGGGRICSHVAALTELGIPVMAHLGLTPQRIHQMGGYRVQGRGDAGNRLVEDALALERAGAFALVLELVPQELAHRVSESLSIPTIGIGAGPNCSGQVLVLHDMLGFNEQFKPRFLKKYRRLGEEIRHAVNEYADDVKQGHFPTIEHSFQES